MEGELLRTMSAAPDAELLPDQSLDAGALPTLPTLHERYGISTAAMVESIKGWLQ